MTNSPPSTSVVSATVPVVAYCILIFAVSNLKDPPAPDFHVEWGDKINHALAFCGMMVVALRASGRLFNRSTVTMRILAAATFCALYGATDELHQAFVPGRNCDIIDWSADVAGILLAVGIVLATRTWRLTRLIVGGDLFRAAAVNPDS